MARITQPDNCQIIVRSRADDRSANDFTTGETDRNFFRSTHHVVVRDDVARTVPYDAGAALLAHTLAFPVCRARTCRRSDHLNY